MTEEDKRILITHIESFLKYFTPKYYNNKSLPYSEDDRYIKLFPGAIEFIRSEYPQLKILEKGEYWMVITK